jgi:hypothetical protein
VRNDRIGSELWVFEFWIAVAALPTQECVFRWCQTNSNSSQLVFRVRHLLPVSPDFIERIERIERAALAGNDIFGGLAPDEGLRLGNPMSGAEH